MNKVNPSAALRPVLEAIGPMAVAVSGGVDSLTLAAAAHKAFGEDFQAFHAVSPAVPPRATERVKRLAQKFSWPISVINAGEFGDRRYLANPVNRCFYCKFNLYNEIVSKTDLPVVSGTNTDDLSDFRPGLKAAEEYNVRHPFVEANIDKSGIRSLASALGLGDIADLPAGPCLSSRLQTGVAVTPERLTFIDRVEEATKRLLAPDTVRCRILSERVEIQLDEESLNRLEDSQALMRQIITIASAGHDLPVGLAPYRRGSSVVHARG